MKKWIAAFLIFVLWPCWAIGADRFWVIGTGTWDGIAGSKWSTTSGGAGGASVPGASDVAIFDANSGGGTVTKSGSASVAGLTMTNAASMTFAGSGAIDSSGSVSLGTNVTYTYSGTLSMSGVGTKSLTTNGKTVTFPINVTNGTVNQSGTFTSTSTFTLTTGTFNTNNSAFTASSFTLSIGTVSLGSSTVTLTGTGTAWSGSGSATLNAGTSTIKLTNTSSSTVTFASAGLTYNNLWFARGSSTGTNRVTGSGGNLGTYNDFKDDGTAAHEIEFGTGSTLTVTTFTVSGNPGALISLRSGDPGEQFFLSKESGTVTVDYLDIQDSNAGGGATWNPGDNSVNSGNNTGWNFPAPPVTVVPAFTLTPP